MKKQLTLLLSFFMSVSLWAVNQYDIKVTIADAPNTMFRLGYRFEDKFYVYDSIKSNDKGVAEFKGEKKIPRGVYFLALPDNNFVELLMGHEQHFSMITTKKNMNADLTFQNNKENECFLQYQRFSVESQKKMEALQQKYKANSEGKKDSLEIYRNMWSELYKTSNEKVKSFEDCVPNSFLTTLLRALRPMPPVPEFSVPENIANKDSVRQLKGLLFIQEHYFDDINFSDNGLIRTPFFKGKIDLYFKNYIHPIPDSISKYIDKIIVRAMKDSLMFQYLTELFFQDYQKSDIMGYEAITVHLADKYYLSKKAHWADSAYLSKIKERADYMRNNLIGKKAINMELYTPEGKLVSLYQVQAPVTILAFWEPSCGHCKTEIPKLYKLYEEYRDRGVEAYVVYTQYKKQEWLEYLSSHPMDWTNVWDGIEVEEKGTTKTYSIGSNFRQNYDIISTPVIYVLDREKKIIAKRAPIDVIKEILEDELAKTEQRNPPQPSTVKNGATVTK